MATILTHRKTCKLNSINKLHHKAQKAQKHPQAKQYDKHMRQEGTPTLSMIHLRTNSKPWTRDIIILLHLHQFLLNNYWFVTFFVDFIAASLKFKVDILMRMRQWWWVGVAGLHHQEAMDVNHHCTPDLEEALNFLMKSSLSYNLCVLGCQLGLKPYDLDTPLPPDQSRPYLATASDSHQMQWKGDSIMDKASQCSKQYRIANKICTTYRIMTGSLESDHSIASLQSPRSGSLERSLHEFYVFNFRRQCRHH